MDCQELYDYLNGRLDDLSAGRRLEVWYAKNDVKDEHLFIVGGSYDSSVENPFEPFSDFVNQYNPKDILLDSSADGFHFTFAFDEDALSKTPSDTSSSMDQFSHKGTNSQHVDECTNCRRTLNGVRNNIMPHRPYPPLKLMFPTEDKFSEPEIEEHHLCIQCSPGHYDDVARNVEYFGVEDSRVSRIGFIETGDTSYGSDERVEWVPRGNLDNPYIEATIKAIESYILTTGS